MTDYESQTERDTLVRLVGQDSALRVLWEENHCLRALLADTEARVKDTEEQLNSTERLLNKRNSEMDRLIAAIADVREAYSRSLEFRDREIADVREAYSRSLEFRDREIADVRSLLDTREDDLAYWKQRAQRVNELSGRMTADVQPLLVGDSLAATARVYRDSRNKITAIKALRSYTGLGLREAKLAVEQIIKIMEMKEAAA